MIVMKQITVRVPIKMGKTRHITGSLMRTPQARSAAHKLLGNNAIFSGGTFWKGNEYLRLGKIPGWRKGGVVVYTFSKRQRGTGNVINGHNPKVPEMERHHSYSYDPLADKGKYPKSFALGQKNIAAQRKPFEKRLGGRK